MLRFEFRDFLANEPLTNLLDDLATMQHLLHVCESDLAECGVEYETDMSRIDLMTARVAIEEVHKSFQDTIRQLVQKLPDLLDQNPLPVMQALGESIRVGHFGPMFNPEVIHVNGGATS